MMLQLLKIGLVQLVMVAAVIAIYLLAALWIAPAIINRKKKKQAARYVKGNSKIVEEGKVVGARGGMMAENPYTQTDSDKAVAWRIGYFVGIDEHRDAMEKARMRKVAP